MTEQEASEPTLVDVVLRIEQSEDESTQRNAVARKLRIPPSRIRELRLRKHSIDARKPQIKVNLRFEVGLDAELPAEPEPTVSLPSVLTKLKSSSLSGADQRDFLQPSPQSNADGSRSF